MADDVRYFAFGGGHNVPCVQRPGATVPAYPTLCGACGTPLSDGHCYPCEQDAYPDFEDEDLGDDDDDDGPTCPHCGDDAPGHYCEWCLLDF